jgi:hypothetical protein
MPAFGYVMLNHITWVTLFCYTLQLYLHKTPHMKHIALSLFVLAASLSAGTVSARSAGLYKVYSNGDLAVATIGIRAGMQVQHLSGNTVWNETYNTGPLAGLLFSVHKKMFGVRVEGTLRAVEYNNNITGKSVNVFNFDVPLLFEFRPVDFIKIHLGPQISTFPRADENNTQDGRRYFKPFDASFVFGAEGILPFNFIAGARYVKGFWDINDSGKYPGAWTTTSAQFYIGYCLAR